ncbi:hypothetical protein B0H14DRAFT_2654757 [Mycena olivaceomarginata]|nr:hypothetical protein B0H14DRAFT_2654757 [Mycena olivaceomarginata]
MHPIHFALSAPQLLFSLRNQSRLSLLSIPRIQSIAQVVSTIQETQEWEEEWGAKVFAIISTYDLELISASAAAARDVTIKHPKTRRTHDESDDEFVHDTAASRRNAPLIEMASSSVKPSDRTAADAAPPDPGRAGLCGNKPQRPLLPIFCLLTSSGLVSLRNVCSGAWRPWGDEERELKPDDHIIGETQLYLGRVHMQRTKFIFYRKVTSSILASPRSRPRGERKAPRRSSESHRGEVVGEGIMRAGELWLGVEGVAMGKERAMVLTMDAASSPGAAERYTRASLGVRARSSGRRSVRARTSPCQLAQRLVFGNGLLDSAAREAAAEEEAPAVVPDDVLEEDTIPLSRLRRPRKWQPMTLERLFGTGVKPSLRTRISRRMQEEEETYMLVMAELDADDDDPDAGAIEIDDDEVYRE